MSEAIPAAVAKKLKDVEAMMQAAQQPALQETPVVQETPTAQEAPMAQESVPQEAASEVAPVAAQDDAIAELRNKLEAAENRYRTLAGMIHVKDEEIRRLQELLTNISAEIKPAKESTQAPVQPSVDEQHDIDEFGADMVDMVKRVVMRVLGDLPHRVEMLEQRSTQTQQVVAETRKERFERQLTELVPNWRELDMSPEFADWLKASPVRVDLARRYMAEYDAQGIAELFRMYALQTAPSVDDSGAQKAKRLEKKVAPAKSVASVQQPSAQDKKVWTKTEIAEVYRNRRNYDAKTFTELEREIAIAQREGRVDFSR